MAESGNSSEGLMDFEAAVAFIRSTGKSAFIAIPIFADDGENAEGAKVFVLRKQADGGFHVRFVAGPFFSAALAADEELSSTEIPESVRQLRYIRSECQEEWFSDQIQILIGKLVQASDSPPAEMPDYLGVPARTAAPEVRFPIAMIGRASTPDTGD